MSSIAMDLICRMHLHDQFNQYDAINICNIAIDA